MESESKLVEEVQTIVAPGGVWTLQEDLRGLISEAFQRLPQKAVSEAERRYPTTPEGLRAFIDGFFTRHFFQVQDSLVGYFCSPAFASVFQRGRMHIADVGSGPSVASLAIVELARAVLTAMKQTGTSQEYSPHLTVDIALNDTSDICLNEGISLIEKYNRMASPLLSIRRIVPVSIPFPASIAQFRRIAGMTEPYDLCCLGYVLIPFSEQVGIQGLADGIRRLAQVGNGRGGQLLLLQDRFREDLHRQICQTLGMSAEMTDLRQRVYDSENQNSEQTYTYCRARSTFSELLEIEAGVA